MDFLEWYKNKITSGEEEPPSRLWEDIQNDLDIDRVYNRLETSLRKDRRKVWLIRGATAASIALLLGLGAILFFLPMPEKPSVADNQTTQTPPDSATNNQQDSKADSVNAPSTTLIGASVKQATLVALSDARIKTKPINIITTNTLTFKDTLAKKSLKKANFEMDFEKKSGLEFSLPEQEYIYTQTDINPLPEKSSGFESLANFNKPKSAFSDFTIGISGELANTWVLNNKTIEGLNPEDFTATRPTFVGNYGLNFAANLSKRWELVSKINFTRKNSQSYNEYIQGKYVGNTINLKYFDFALMGRIKPFRKNLNHNLSAGLYTAFLQDATQNIDGEQSNITSDFSNTDFGLIGGYEYRAPLTGVLTLSTGVFYRMGLKNIFAGNQLVSRELNHSINTSLNFTVSVDYKFSL
ncbi:outer membrane beta-barrel protein [Marinilabilia rubra]|uniref:PorT family protein n=1 Tax=Marinilabilia rubra TaxID=2162893 RepID=A0A2U2B6G5_9BACT|nr:outer membrane beta-barrel protein [Marinilabilia rubra]PWD98633.1 PorT family protein [Marinilabilia rubra]